MQVLPDFRILQCRFRGERTYPQWLFGNVHMNSYPPSQNHEAVKLGTSEIVGRSGSLGFSTICLIWIVCYGSDTPQRRTESHDAVFALPLRSNNTMLAWN